jgi:hypothetical protein
MTPTDIIAGLIVTTLLASGIAGAATWWGLTLRRRLRNTRTAARGYRTEVARLSRDLGELRDFLAVVSPRTTKDRS